MKKIMRQILNFFIGRHSVFTSVVLLIVLDFLLIANLIIPKLLQFLIDKHIFEIVVLTALVQVLVLLSSSFWHITPLVIGSEEEAQEKVRLILKEDTSIKSVKVLSAGLRSRANFLRALLELPRRLNVEIVACFGQGSPNPDKLDREQFGPAHFGVITHRLDQETSSRLKIYGSFNTPSLRCVLLYDSHGPRYGIIGWYTYHKKNNEIVGCHNVQFLVDRTTEFGFTLLRFAERIYGSYVAPEEANIFWPPKIVSEREKDAE